MKRVQSSAIVLSFASLALFSGRAGAQTGSVTGQVFDPGHVQQNAIGHVEAGVLV